MFSSLTPRTSFSLLKPLLGLHLLLSSRMSSASVSCCPSASDIEDLDGTIGFARPLPPPTQLHNSVKPFRFHAFLSTGTSDWPWDVSDLEGFRDFSKAFFNSSKSLPFWLVLTGSDQKSSNPDPDVYEIVIFPEGFKIQITIDEIPELIQRLTEIAPRTTSYADGIAREFPFPHTPVDPSETYAYVCAHNNMDKRCGYCGPRLVDLFHEDLKKKEIANVQVYKCSHIGGHRFAGNLVVFPQCDWYGNVVPANATELVDTVFVRREILPELHRGNTKTGDQDFSK